MGMFGKKKVDRDEIIAQGLADAEAEAAAAEQGKKDGTFNSGNPKTDMEITKINAQLESYGEIRKANSERFSRLSEQMGELRGMIMDTNKTMSKIEVSATKAIDLVESVHPEKLMIEIRKQEGKQEALKANIESNEAMMSDLMNELKKMRQQMNFYKGIEQVAKLNEEVKTEILDIKKVEATIERHADKAETIFLDLEKKFAEFEKFQRTVDDLDKTFHAIQGDFDKMKLQLSKKAEKREFGSIMDKFTEFEKHTGNILKLLDERSRHMKDEQKQLLKKIKDQLKKKHNITIDENDIRASRLPPEEKKYLDKAAGTAGAVGADGTEGTTETDGTTEQPKKEEGAEGAPAEGIEEPPKIEGKKEEPTSESSTSTETSESHEVDKELLSDEESPKLGDVLKKRRIISKHLSDEVGQEPEQPSEWTEDAEKGKKEDKKDSEPEAEPKKTEENKWE